MTRPEWIEVVRVVPDTDNPERFTEGSVVYARAARQGVAGAPSGERMALTLASVRGDDDFPIINFAGIADRGVAEGLRGYVLEVPSAELPALGEDEFYPFEIEGLTARDTDGQLVGCVTEVLDSPAHGLLVIRLESGREVLVPFVSAAVTAVLPTEGYLVVDRRYLEVAGGEADRPNK
jgi:16S rRNA processing protein RimM